VFNVLHRSLAWKLNSLGHSFDSAFQPSLAYLTAVTHGLTQDAERIAQQYFGDKLDSLPAVDASARLVQPPVPIMPNQPVWPLLTMTKGFFDAPVKTTTTTTSAAITVTADDEEAAGWDADDIDIEGSYVPSLSCLASRVQNGFNSDMHSRIWRGSL
jgi:hypothetical protein